MGNEYVETPQYVIVDVLGKIVCEGSYMMCEWHMEKGQDARTFGGKIVLRKKHIENIVNKAMKSIWWNTIQRFIEIEGGKFDNNSIKFVDGVIEKHLLPIMYQDTPETGLNKFYKTGFMTFDDRLGTQKVTDLGDFIRFRLTFGDRPINHDAILEINTKLL